MPLFFQTPEQIEAAKKAADPGYSGIITNPNAGMEEEARLRREAGLDVVPTRNVPGVPALPSGASPYGFDSETARQDYLARDLESRRKSSQSVIDSIRAGYEQLIREEKQKGEERFGQQRALQSSSGLLESGRGSAALAKEEQYTVGNVAKIQGDLAAKLAELEYGIQESARTDTTAEEARRKGDYETFTKLKDKSKSDLLSRVSNYAKAPGSTYDKFIQSLGNNLSTILQKGGFESAEEFKGYFASQIPETQLLGDKPIISGNKVVFFKKDPTSPNGYSAITLDAGTNLESTKDTQIVKGNDGYYAIDKKTLKTTKLGVGIPASGGGAVTSEMVSNAVNQVISGKAAPSQFPGFGANSLKAQVLARLAKDHPNFDLEGAEANFTAKQAYTRYINSPTYQNTIKYLESVTPNLNEVVRLSDNIPRSFFRPLNKAQLAVMRNSGDPKVAAYAAASLEVADQLAKILQGGGTGSGTSDAKIKQAVDILDGSYSPKQFKALAQELSTLLANRKNALETNTLQTIQGQVQQEKSTSGALEGALGGVTDQLQGLIDQLSPDQLQELQNEGLK